MPDGMAVSVGSARVARDSGVRRLARDSRVDALRGIALLMIFIDHVPGNVLSLVTLRNFGFADSAELFVLLAGFASMVAYGGSFDRNGVLHGLRRVLMRCLRLYLFQALLLAAVLVGVGPWIRHFGIGPESGAPFVHSGLNGLRHGLLLQAQPASLNILPLYIVLLAAFPLVYGLIALNPLFALGASCAVWAAAPWTTWGWSDFHPVVLDTPDKTVLAPARLLNVLAIAVLALGSIRFRTLAERLALRVLVVCGRNSLEVFSLGTILAMICRLVFRTFGVTVATQLLANAIGIGLMIALAFALERVRRPGGARNAGHAQRAAPAAKKALAHIHVVTSVRFVEPSFPVSP